MPQQRQRGYNSTRIATLLAGCEKHNSLLEVELVTGAKHVIKPHVLRSPSYVVSDKGAVAFSTIVSHREIKPNRSDSFRLDSLTEGNQATIYHIDNVLSNLKHYEIDSSGFLRFICPVSRTGALRYYDEQRNEFYDEYVDENCLIDSAESLKGKPITSPTHPPIKLNPQNVSQYTKGSTTNLTFLSNSWLWCGGTLFDQRAIDQAINGQASQVSLGYDAKIAKRDNKFHQVKRDVNHFSLVGRGRAGDQIALKLDVSDREIQRLTPPNEMLDFLRVNGKRVY